MRGNVFWRVVLVLSVMMFAATTQAQVTSIITGTDGGNDSWNTETNWDANGIPTGTGAAIIDAGITAKVENAATPTYSGGLTMGTGSTLYISNTGGDGSLNAIGTGPIIMDGSTINTATASDPHFGPITLNGTGGTFTNGSNAADWDARYFDGVIDGTGALTLVGRNGNPYRLTQTNTFSGDLVLNAVDRYYVYLDATGAAGAGDVTVSPRNTSDYRSAIVIVNAADAIADTAILTLNGQGQAGSTKGSYSGRYTRLDMKYDDTVAELWIDGAQMFAGTYTGTPDASDWIDGTGTLTVSNGPEDFDPTLANSDIADEFEAGPNAALDQVWSDQASVTYTFTFSDDMDEATVDATDFENGGTAGGYTIGTITKTVTPPNPTSPSEFTVEVNLTGATGTLQLQVKADADLTDVGGNPLDTTSAIPDNDTLTINAGNTPTGTYAGTDGGNNSWNQTTNWDSGFVPFGPGGAIIADGNTVKVEDAMTPVYSGSLTLGIGSTLALYSTGGAANANALGASITMHDGSKIALGSANYTVNFPAMNLAGDVTMDNPSNPSHHTTRNFNGEITGTGNLTFFGNNNITLNLNAASPDWSGDFTANGGGWRVEANVAEAFGSGNVTINAGVTLIIDANDVMGDAAILTLNGSKDGRKASKLILNGDDTISEFWLDEVQLADGEYDSLSGLLDIDGLALISGDGTLTVEAFSTAPLADADGDGDVDAADYIMIKTNFGGLPGAEGPGGDIADGSGNPGTNGVVDWYDLQLFQENYNVGDGDTIPEPATLFIMLGAGFPALLKRRLRF